MNDNLVELAERFVVAAWNSIPKPHHHFPAKNVGHKAGLTPAEIDAVLAELIAKKFIEPLMPNDERHRFTSANAGSGETYAAEIVNAVARRERERQVNIPVVNLSVPEYTERQIRFLEVALASATDGTFDFREVAKAADIPEADAGEVVHSLNPLVSLLTRKLAQFGAGQRERVSLIVAKFREAQKKQEQAEEAERKWRKTRKGFSIANMFVSHPLISKAILAGGAYLFGIWTGRASVSQPSPAPIAQPAAITQPASIPPSLPPTTQAAQSTIPAATPAQP